MRIPNGIARPLKASLLASHVNRLLACVAGRPMIVAFHRVKTFSDNALDRRAGTIEPAEFEKMIGYVLSPGYEYVRLDVLVDELLKGKGRRKAAITFDDCFKDLHLSAYPFLKRHGLPFTLFLITPSALDQKGPFPVYVIDCINTRHMSRGAFLG